MIIKEELNEMIGTVEGIYTIIMLIMLIITLIERVVVTKELEDNEKISSTYYNGVQIIISIMIITMMWYSGILVGNSEIWKIGIGQQVWVCMYSMYMYKVDKKIKSGSEWLRVVLDINMIGLTTQIIVSYIVENI